MFRLVKYFLIERFIYVCIYSVFYVYINCIDFKSGYLIKCIKKGIGLYVFIVCLMWILIVLILKVEFFLKLYKKGCNLLVVKWIYIFF